MQGLIRELKLSNGGIVELEYKSQTQQESEAIRKLESLPDRTIVIVTDLLEDGRRVRRSRASNKAVLRWWATGLNWNPDVTTRLFWIAKTKDNPDGFQCSIDYREHKGN